MRSTCFSLTKSNVFELFPNENLSYAFYSYPLVNLLVTHRLLQHGTIISGYYLQGGLSWNYSIFKVASRSESGNSQVIVTQILFNLSFLFSLPNYFVANAFLNCATIGLHRIKTANRMMYIYIQFSTLTTIKNKNKIDDLSSLRQRRILICILFFLCLLLGQVIKQFTKLRNGETKRKTSLMLLSSLWILFQFDQKHYGLLIQDIRKISISKISLRQNCFFNQSSRVLFYRLSVGQLPIGNKYVVMCMLKLRKATVKYG